MSKRQFKAQASSERAAGGLQFSNAFGFSSASSAFGKGSALSYLVEPPDVSPFSDPNVKVAVKNLSKKDSTTKSRALEDLQNYFLSLEEEKQPLEDGVLEAWVCFDYHHLWSWVTGSPFRSNFIRVFPSKRKGECDNLHIWCLGRWLQ